MTPDWQFVGEGGEARVWKSFFKFSEFGNGIWVTKREISLSPTNLGKRYYDKNVIMSRLDDYFIQEGFYTVKHIPKAIGFYDKGHFYEFVEGDDSFNWTVYDIGFVPIKVQLDEWGKFVAVFNEAGFDVNEDIARVDSSSAIGAKNIVHSNYKLEDEFNGTLNKDWKRIDIGEDSLPWNRNKTEEFIRKHGIRISNYLLNYSLKD